VYAYHGVLDAEGQLIETGTVCPVPTAQATGLLTDLVKAGTRPPVMILRSGPAGNHFQAVHYDEDEHDVYAKNIAAFAEIRNRILIEYGWKAMDSIEYDPVKTAHAAKETLTTVRRQAKAIQAPAGTGDSADGRPQLKDVARGGEITPVKDNGSGRDELAEPKSSKTNKAMPNSQENAAAQNTGRGTEQTGDLTEEKSAAVITEVTTGDIGVDSHPVLEDADAARRKAAARS
jgi:hypothetical protein